MTEQEFIEICEQYKREFDAWSFADPKKKKCLKVKRKKRLFTKNKYSLK